jgi:hypothetical protein
LLDKWQKARSYKNMTHDGIIGEKNYWEKRPRITFLLKESSDIDYAGSIAPGPDKGYGPHGSHQSFWPNLGSWKYIIQHRVSISVYDISIENLGKSLMEPVTGIGYVNIKKESGKDSSEFDDIRYYAINDAKYLREQLDMMKSDVIFCCGYDEKKGSVFECFKFFYPCKIETYDGNGSGIHIFDNNLLVIDWWHPSSCAEYLKWYYLDKILCQDDSKKELVKLINNYN